MTVVSVILCGCRHYQCRLWLAHLEHVRQVGPLQQQVFRSIASSMPKATVKTLVSPDPPLGAPALNDQQLCFSYEIARGEMGVLSFEPCEICSHQVYTNKFLALFSQYK